MNKNSDLLELNRLLALLKAEWIKADGSRNYKGVVWEK